MKDIVTKTVDIQLEGLPLPEASKTKLRPALMQFFDKYMSFDSLKEDMANLYLKYFTVKEIQELMKFLQTPAGKKFIKNQSKLFSEGAEIGAKRVKMHEAELTQMIMKALQD